jgi:hypothetical protein
VRNNNGGVRGVADAYSESLEAITRLNEEMLRLQKEILLEAQAPFASSMAPVEHAHQL